MELLKHFVKFITAVVYKYNSNFITAVVYKYNSNCIDLKNCISNPCFYGDWLKKNCIHKN